MSQLRRRKDSLLDLWLSWQYKDGVDKDVNAQWENVKSTADRVSLMPLYIIKLGLLMVKQSTINC